MMPGIAILDWLSEPLRYGFMQRGLLASVLVGVVCAVIGCYVVLRGMAFLGDAMAHAILPGVAVAYLWGANLLLGAAVAAVAVVMAVAPAPARRAAAARRVGLVLVVIGKSYQSAPLP